MADEGQDQKFHQLVILRGESKGKRWLLKSGQAYTIGRDADNEITLNDQSVSRSHALIHQVDGVWMVQDVESTHGTHINEERVDGRSPIFHKDVLRLGKSSLVFGAVKHPELQENAEKAHEQKNQ
ncbi:MAG: FHA domain-containing protein [Candidatus Brocadiia bacterium]